MPARWTLPALASFRKAAVAGSHGRLRTRCIHSGATTVFMVTPSLFFTSVPTQSILSRRSTAGLRSPKSNSTTHIIGFRYTPTISSTSDRSWGNQPYVDPCCPWVYARNSSFPVTLAPDDPPQPWHQIHRRSRSHSHSPHAGMSADRSSLRRLQPFFPHRSRRFPPVHYLDD